MEGMLGKDGDPSEISSAWLHEETEEWTESHSLPIIRGKQSFLDGIGSPVSKRGEVTFGILKIGLFSHSFQSRSFNFTQRSHTVSTVICLISLLLKRQNLD